MSPTAELVSTTAFGILDSKEMVELCTPSRIPIRLPKSLAIALVSKVTSILRPSAAFKVTPSWSEPVSSATTPVLSLMRLIARATLARVSRGLFIRVSILADA